MLKSLRVSIPALNDYTCSKKVSQTNSLTMQVVLVSRLELGGSTLIVLLAVNWRSF